MKHKEMLDLRKKEMLHFKWKERVFEPIRNQVDKEIHSPMYDELAQRKRALHKEYIEHNNKKVCALFGIDFNQVYVFNFI